MRLGGECGDEYEWRCRFEAMSWRCDFGVGYGIEYGVRVELEFRRFHNNPLPNPIHEGVGWGSGMRCGVGMGFRCGDAECGVDGCGHTVGMELIRVWVCRQG